MNQKTAEALKAYMDSNDDAVWYLTEHCTDDHSVKTMIRDIQEKRNRLLDLLYVDGNPPWSLT